MPKANLNLSVLEWFALVPWFLAINKKRPLYAFLISFWMGIFFWGITIYWLHLVTGLGFFLLVSYLGLYFAIFGWVIGYTMKKGNLFFLVGPPLWVLLELVRGVLLGGFPWSNLSHGQYPNIPLLQWASLGGEGIVSGVIVLVNLIILAIFLSTEKKRVLLTGFLFLILIFTHVGGKILLGIEWRDRTRTLRLATIQPNITVEKWDEKSLEKNFDILIKLSYESLSQKPCLLIWPETSFAYDFERERSYLEILKKFAREYNCYLLVGAVREAGGGNFYNCAVLVSPGSETSSYDKVRLVPFGEYLPLGARWPWWKRWVENIAGYRFSFVPGKAEKILRMDETSFGVLICFEDIFPALSRRFKQKGVKFLVNMTDDRWFGKGSAPYQHLAASVFRAVENRLPLVRSANTGVSAFIDSSGRIIKIVEKEGKALFVRGFVVEEIFF